MATITGRTEMAKAINLEGRKVMTFNLDKTPEYSRGSTAVVLNKSSNPRYNGMRTACTLGRDYDKAGDGVFYLANPGSMLTAEVSISTYLKFAENANAPAINEGDRCAVVVYSKLKNTIEVHTVIAGPVRSDCTPACRFVEE